MRFLMRLPRIAMPILRLMAAFILITLSGCYPIQLADEKPFKDDRLAFLEIGTTTKEQVAAAMSNFTIHTDGREIAVILTPQVFRGGDWWLYTQDRETLQFGVPGPDGSDIPIGERTDHRFLLVKFDENGVVYDYEVSSMLKDGCNKSGVCKHFSDYMLLARQDQDDLVKTFQPNDDGCSVYLYVERKTKSPFPVRGGLDDGPPTRLINRDAFLYWAADFGQHQVKVFRNVGDQPIIESEIACVQSQVFIVEFHARKRGYELRLDVVEESDGRREIIKRRLVLMDLVHEAIPPIVAGFF